jgi:hypothetical protein
MRSVGSVDVVGGGPLSEGSPFTMDMQYNWLKGALVEGLSM